LVAGVLLVGLSVSGAQAAVQRIEPPPAAKQAQRVSPKSAGGATAPSGAATRKPAAPEPFRVVALITSYGGLDAVSLCFPTPLDHQKAAAIVQHIAQLGGWQPLGLQIADDRFISTWDEATQKNPKGELQTYVDFSAAGVISKEQRWIALNPFIVALKNFSPMRLALGLGEQVIVEGPGDYSDNKVQIECNRLPGSIVYDITVKDSDLTSTGVPAAPPVRRTRAAPATGERDSALPWLVGLAVVLALSALAVLGLWRIWQRKVSWSSAAKRVRVRPDVGAPESKHKSG
jgi:hypothetical protein